MKPSIVAVPPMNYSAVHGNRTAFAIGTQNAIDVKTRK